MQQEIQQGKKVYPLQQKIFRVFNALSPQKIKVMILGQDPYHQKGQADGFAFLGKHSQPTIATKLTKYLQRNFTNKKTAI